MPDDLPPVIPAATVVLLRDGERGLETLMLRRDPSLAFAGGAWVFPGGRIDAADQPEGVVPDDPDGLERAARRAAVRETAEEAALTVDADALVWFAHWTPGGWLARRFATWFFMACAPAGAVVVDGGEIRDHRWIRPAEALERRDRGEIELITPTWMTLHRLAGEQSVDAAIERARSVPPEVYLTHFAAIDGGHASIWAGDVAYDDLDTARPGPRNRLLQLDDSPWRLQRT